ncbi:MAG: hypothetical protein OHK93_004599 [Ramalina farinacea]|uniref:Uncharacterized protein n=1 Tax=Ramalina farinacea TaxID=258253 RepID=A0AA43QUD5_9LECA|nr:hypothetical protein [Ramalina farinacea]
MPDIDLLYPALDINENSSEEVDWNRNFRDEMVLSRDDRNNFFILDRPLKYAFKSAMQNCSKRYKQEIVALQASEDITHLRELKRRILELTGNDGSGIRPGRFGDAECTTLA